jgi:hypothetical protein
MNKLIKCFAPIAVLSCATLQAQTSNLVNNPGFETSIEESWGSWVAPESKTENCRYAISNENPHSGTACMKLTADDFSRFCVGPKQSYEVQAGERYRIGFWIRGNAETAPKASGFAVRLTVSPVVPGLDGSGHDLVYIGLDGKVKINSAPVSATTIPSQWTHVSGVIAIPDGVNKITFGLFMIQARGDVCLDDVSVEKVDASTPLSEIVQ